MPPAATGIPQRTLVRSLVQGVVYLLDPATGAAYTYNVDRPVFLGRAARQADGELRLKLRPDYAGVLEEESGRAGYPHVRAAMRALSSP